MTELIIGAHTRRPTRLPRIPKSAGTERMQAGPPAALRPELRRAALGFRPAVGERRADRGSACRHCRSRFSATGHIATCAEVARRRRSSVGEWWGIGVCITTHSDGAGPVYSQA